MFLDWFLGAIYGQDFEFFVLVLILILNRVLMFMWLR